MVRKTRQRITYVLPLPGSDETAGHRLGINRLALDCTSSLLYSAGRDGAIYSWKLATDLTKTNQLKSEPVSGQTSQHAKGYVKEKEDQSTYENHVQAHTHWINDICLVQQNSALVSASSDTSVKVWRPKSNAKTSAETIGLHTDYVKCVASPESGAPWVAAAGLDRKICLWDINGSGKRLEFEVPDPETTAKGSVYALSARNNIIASGGPENIVKLWDQRSGTPITKFVGHTDNIRSILLSDGYDHVISASSDRTIKVWSMSASRCAHSFTLHEESVWTLYSNVPDLGVFYSADRSGLVVKTDIRDVADMDQGLSIALCQEQEGINHLVCAADSVWTATARSSINRWLDFDTSNAMVPISDTVESVGRHEHISRKHTPTSSRNANQPVLPSNMNVHDLPKVPIKSILSFGRAGIFHPPSIQRNRTSIYIANARKSSVVSLQAEVGKPTPIRSTPNHTIVGRIGLIKHTLLSDRRRVLTLDTSGEIVLWDLIKCIPIRSFGRRDLETVSQELNSFDSVAHWCDVSTSTGTLTCTLEENHCFDAEVYADELKEAETSNFKEDQRLNLGKWVLRYLFDGFIEEELVRDQQFRYSMTNRASDNDKTVGKQTRLFIPTSDRQTDFEVHTSGQTRYSTQNSSLVTPSLLIGRPTPSHTAPQHTPDTEDNSHNNSSKPDLGSIPSDADKTKEDYFSSKLVQDGKSNSEAVMHTPTPTSPSSLTPKANSTAQVAETEKSNTAKDSASFGKRLRNSFAPSKMFTKATTADVAKSQPVEEPESTESKHTASEEAINEDSIVYALTLVRQSYTNPPGEGNSGLPTSALIPPPQVEAPHVVLPASTLVIIQEDRPSSGGFADLLEMRVDSTARYADLLEKVGPFWLGDVLLRNRMPTKDIVKISFILQPYDNTVPIVTNDNGLERLNANRMLRSKKIAAYIAERLEFSEASELKPEEYLEIYCQDQLLSPNITLAVIRAQIWRSGGDVSLYYRANGKRLLARNAANKSERRPASSSRES